MSFYLHPNGVDGETLDYRVAANTLTPKFGVAEPDAGERFDCKRWLDALEQMWIGRLDYYECHHPDRGYGEIHGHTEELRQCLKEFRAIKKGASNHRI